MSAKNYQINQNYSLCPWLSWVVGESIEPGELTDRPIEDMFITFECSFVTCS